MVHLFFDSAAYPWTFPEARALWKLLSATYPAWGEIDLIRRICDPNIVAIAAGSPDDMWSDMLDNVATANRLKEFDSALRSRRSPHLDKALDRLIAAVNPNTATWFLETPIFVNRLQLRTALAELASPKTDKNVLIVRGDPQSGKSWTRHVVRHFADVLGEGCNYLYEPVVTTVDQAVDYIFMELGGEAPQRLTTEAAWYGRVAQTMVKAAQARNRGSWIVVDDLGAGLDGTPRMEPEVRKLFEQLALHMLNPAFAKWFKLVLIGYPDKPAPSKWLQITLEDRTTAADMHPEAVSNFLCRWAAWKGKNLSDALALSLAHDVLARATCQPGRDDSCSVFQRVHNELDSALKNL